MLNDNEAVAAYWGLWYWGPKVSVMIMFQAGASSFERLCSFLTLTRAYVRARMSEGIVPFPYMLTMY